MLAEEVLVLKYVQGRRETLSENNSWRQWKGKKAGGRILGRLQERNGLSGRTAQHSIKNKDAGLREARAHTPDPLNILTKYVHFLNESLLYSGD